MFAGKTDPTLVLAVYRPHWYIRVVRAGDREVCDEFEQILDDRLFNMTESDKGVGNECGAKNTLYFYIATAQRHEKCYFINTIPVQNIFENVLKWNTIYVINYLKWVGRLISNLYILYQIIDRHKAGRMGQSDTL